MTRMWEAAPAQGRAGELLAWVLAAADPAAAVYRGDDGRVVVVDPTGSGLPDPPGQLVAAPPQAWDFTPVRR